MTVAEWEGGAVYADANGPSATTNKRGRYSIQNVAEGLRIVTASKSGFTDFEDTVTLTAGSTATLDFSLN